MKVLVNKKIAEMLNAIQKDPRLYDGTLTKELLLERMSLADKERAFSKRIVEIRKDFEAKLTEEAHGLTKLRGSIEYVEGKILESLKD